MMSSKWAVVATVLAGLGAACSGSGQRTAPTATTLAPLTKPSTTSNTRPSVVAVTGSSEPWTLPAAVSRPVVLPDRPGFVILGGLTTGDTSTSRIVTVDPAGGDARVTGHLAIAVHDSAGAVIGGRFFVFGGGSTSTISVIQAYSTGSAAQVGSLPEARSDLATATLDGTTYIVGGFNGSAMTPDVLATTDGVSFRPVAELAVPVRYAAVAVFGDSLWVIGGVTSTNEGGTTETDAIQRVNLRSGQVTVTGRLPHPMGHATALVLGGQILVLGGRSGTVASAAIWHLDPASGALVLAGQLPGPVSDAGAVVVGHVGYLVGGEVTGPSQPLDSVVVLRLSLRDQ